MNNTITNCTLSKRLLEATRTSLVNTDSEWRNDITLDFETLILDFEEVHNSASGMSMSDYHQRSASFRVNDMIDGEAFREWIADYDFTDLAEGYSFEWDGSNWKGHLTQEAGDWLARFQEALQDVPVCEYVDFCELREDDILEAISVHSFEITKETTDTEIQDIANSLQSDYESEGIIVEHIYSALRAIKDNLE